MILNTQKTHNSVSTFRCFSPVDPYLFSTQIKLNWKYSGPSAWLTHATFICITKNEYQKKTRKKGKERPSIVDHGSRSPFWPHKSSNHVIFNLQAQTITIFTHLFVSVFNYLYLLLLRNFQCSLREWSSCQLKSIFCFCVNWLIDKLI